ncbi:MAG: hypothetical protein PF569_01385 [Candidatus Woesearchaeota archaeon]|jgi:acetone carboxylase gamma subunit|nr:hypothetical protein [Candidatus Woesearchaeota archaeon]
MIEYIKPEDTNSIAEYTSNIELRLLPQIRDLEATLLEMSQALVEECTQESVYGNYYCTRCHHLIYDHNADSCIVGKAEKYLEEMRENEM